MNENTIREAFDLVEKLSEIEQALVGRQYDVEYNEWMKKAGLADLMIKID